MRKITEKTVTCVDIQGNKSIALVKDLTFRPAVYGVIIQNHKILLSPQWGGYDLPGGGVKIGETIQKTLIREVKEETGFEVKPGRVVTIENSFFKLPSSGKVVQSILIFFTADIITGQLTTRFFDHDEKTYAKKAEWIDLKRIPKLKFYNSVDTLKIIKQSQKLND